MVAEMVHVGEVQEEIGAMIAVCFEGQVVNLGDHLELTLPSGQRFNIYIEEA